MFENFIEDAPDLQIDTPDLFKHTIEKIVDEDLNHYFNFNDYIKNLYSELNCGVPYFARHTSLNFSKKCTWRFECCYGGRTRKTIKNTRKSWKCKSYIEFTVEKKGNNMYITLKKADWTHSHPVEGLFNISNSIIPESKIMEISDAIQKGALPTEIRKKPDYALIPPKKFYQIKQKCKKNKELNEIELFIQNCENIKDIFHIVNHWKTEQLTNVTKYNGSTFISKRFYDLNIATDIVFMDDTCCVNYFDFPLICITFEDFNGVRQLLAFGFLPSKEEKDFNSFLYDIKNYISKPIRVFIVDRLKSQAKSIKNIFINAEIVYCRVHLERNIRTTFGHYSKIGSLIHQLFNGKITNEIYLNNLDELIDQIKKHKNALIRLREEFNSYCPSYLSQLRLRNNYTTNPQEGFFGNFKQRFGNQRISLSELLNGVVGFYQAAIVNSMKITPKKFKKNICSAPNLGVLAFDKLCDQLKESSHIMNLLKSENNEDIIKGREILNKECKCIIKHEFGLPCYHDIINNATNTLNPIIPIESIPNIYFYSGPSIEEETKIVNIQDDNGEKIDFSFTNLMSMFAKVAVKAPKNKKIQENIVSMFQEIDKSEIDDNPEPLTLKEKGRKPSRPAIRNSGAKKRKRTNQCGYCHGYGHNKATCKLYKLSLQSNEKDEKNDQFNNQIDEENNHFNNGNNDLDENDIQYYSSDSNENQLNDFSNNCNSDNMNYFANDSSDDLINDFNDLKSNSNNLKDYSENEETDLSNDDSIQNIESYLEHLSNNQIKILEKCPSFKKFIIQITQPKNQYDRPTVNGIYYSQYPTILRYASSHLIEGEAAEINAIKLIYLMNFNAEIPNNLIPEILEMVKYFVDDDIGI